MRLLVLLLLLLSPALALTGAQEARVQQLGSTLRCPVCRGLPLTESPNEISAQMLQAVREQVTAGRSDEQIYAYFASRFGENVLLDPPRRGINLALWALPVVALAAGAALLARYLRQASRAARSEPDPELLARLERDLKEGS